MYLSTHAASRTSAASAGLCGFCFERSGILYTNTGDFFQLANDPSPIFPPVVGIQGGSHVPGSRGTFGFVGQFGENYAVAYTIDAGESWQRAPLTYRGPWARYISMPSATTWYVTCGTWPRSKTDGPRPLFEKFNIVEGNGTQAHYQLQYNYEDLTSRKLLQSGGYQTAILKTTNAGASWTVVFERLNNDYYLNNINCPTVNLCFSVGDGSRGVGIRSTDGGATWEEVLNEAGATLQFMDVKFVDQRQGFVAGAFLSQSGFVGYMYESTDGGNSWTRQDVPGVAPVSISLYPHAGGIGGHGTALTIDGQSSTIVYR